MYNELLQPDLKMMLAEHDDSGLREFCSVLNPVVVAEVLHGMGTEDSWKVLNASPIERQAEIFEFVEATQQLAMVSAIDRKHLSQLIEAMSADDRIDLLEHMDDEHVASLLPLIAQAERDEIRKMLSYPDDAAGNMMTTEYASLTGNITAREALDRLREQAPDRETIYYVYVVDEHRHLQGVVTLRELILARSTAMLSDIMCRNLVSVHVTDEQQDVARQIARFDLIAIPVLDEEQRLVGIITHDDAIDIIREEATEDAYRQSAMEPLEHSYFSTPLLTITWKRAIWLLILATMALGTATVMRFFSGKLDARSWLDWFLPLVLASGGNTGSQSATLVIRALALAPLGRRDRFRLIQREFCSGLILGATLGLYVFAAVPILFGLSIHQSSVVGWTIAFVVTTGTVIGSMLPLMFDRLGMDPALMSNPLIAALSDNFGVVIYFTVALVILGAVAG